MNTRMRRRIQVASGVLGATAGTAVAALFLVSQLGAGSYATGRYEQAASVGKMLTDVPGADVVHGRFLQGTALAAAGDLDAATEALEGALSHARADGDDCGLRFNLALVLEARGDADADPAVAAAFFERAAVVASGARGDCRLRPFGGGPDGEPGETAGVELDGLADRTRAKADAADAENGEEQEGVGEGAGGDAGDGTPDGEAPPADPEPTPQDGELVRRMGQGSLTQSDALREHNDEVSGQAEAPVDRPW